MNTPVHPLHTVYPKALVRVVIINNVNTVNIHNFALIHTITLRGQFRPLNNLLGSFQGKNKNTREQNNTKPLELLLKEIIKRNRESLYTI